MRTGLTHVFRRKPGVNRSVAEKVWKLCRDGKKKNPTAGDAPGFVQANLVVVPKKYAFDFLKFCLMNPKPCPVLDVTEPGSKTFRNIAPNADVSTDLPLYRVWRHGVLEKEVTDVQDLYGDDMVAFALGCSFSWEDVLAENKLIPRHVEMSCNVPMYRTNISNKISGPFGGHLVVSMRPYTLQDVKKVTGITSCYPGAHGGPIHVGDPKSIGIKDLNCPDFGDKIKIRDDEIPVFWACGVTPQSAIEAAKIPLAITHSPGHMLICDVLNSELRVSESETSP